MTASTAKEPDYVLGSSEEELARLARQARILDEFTEPLLRQAGIGPGMRVLDVGCGAGDVAFLVAGLVGPGGRVIGVDRAAEALESAGRRARETGRDNVAFVQGDLGAEALDVGDGPFDAVTGRAVLYVLRDPVATLRGLARRVRPGGLLVFHEPDFSPTGLAWPPSPLWRTIGRWFRELQQKAGLDSQMGLKLHAAFVQAGLPAPQLRHDVGIDGGPGSPYYDWIASTCRSILPGLVGMGVATAEEVGVDTLAARLRAEVVAGGGVLMTMPFIGAWTRTPDGAT
jgi:SAM-dependent methyltransferase